MWRVRRVKTHRGNYKPWEWEEEAAPQLMQTWRQTPASSDQVSGAHNSVQGEEREMASKNEFGMRVSKEIGM